MATSSRAALAADLRRLSLQTLAVCWLTQGLLAALIAQGLPIPVRPLVVDRGACTPGQWRELLRRYGHLHVQDRLGLRRFRPVIQTSVFGERLSPHPPAPEELAAARPVGVREEGRLAALADRYPAALVLSCASTVSAPPP
jgi:hypothetical protein